MHQTQTVASLLSKYVCSLFNDDDSNSDHTMLNDINESEQIWSDSRYCLHLSCEGTE